MLRRWLPLTSSWRRENERQINMRSFSQKYLQHTLGLTNFLLPILSAGRRHLQLISSPYHLSPRRSTAAMCSYYHLEQHMVTPRRVKLTVWIRHHTAFISPLSHTQARIHKQYLHWAHINTGIVRSNLIQQNSVAFWVLQHEYSR